MHTRSFHRWYLRYLAQSIMTETQHWNTDPAQEPQIDGAATAPIAAGQAFPADDTSGSDIMSAQQDEHSALPSEYIRTNSKNL
jgi:hypothetical protein